MPTVAWDKNTDRHREAATYVLFGGKGRKIGSNKKTIGPKKIRKSVQPKLPDRGFRFGLSFLSFRLLEEPLVDPHGASDRAHTGQSVDQ